MDRAEALQIVYDLADENKLEEGEIIQDEEILRPIAKKQQEALNIVHDIAVNDYGDD